MHAVSSQSASEGRTISTSLYCANVMLRPLGHVTGYKIITIVAMQ